MFHVPTTLRTTYVSAYFLLQQVTNILSILLQMLPLLQEDFCHSKKVAMQPCVDSEGDDTEFVLMQMQKSKESLAVSIV